jgi:uncharacterized delta-60 repeat protein
MSQFKMVCVEALESRVCLSAGDLNPSFGHGGLVKLPDAGAAVGLAVQPDGDVLVASNSGVSRFTPNGSRDDTFASPGAGYRVDAGITVLSMVLQPDGKVIVAGIRNNVDWAIIRLLPTGSPDPTFGRNGDGHVFIPLTSTPPPLFPGSTTPTHALHAAWTFVRPNGSIVVAGYGDYASIPDDLSTGGIRAVQLQADGTLDPTFGTVGQVLYSTNVLFPSNARLRDFTLLSDGTLLGVGSTFFDASADAAYAIDTGGHTSSYTPPRFADRYDVAIAASNGSPIFAATNVYRGDGTGFVGGSSIVTSDNIIPIDDHYPFHSPVINALLSTPDDKIILAGAAIGGSGRSQFALGRFNADGTPDSSFGFGGTAFVGGKLSNATLTHVTFAPNGDVIAVGTRNGHVAIADFEGGSHPLENRTPRAFAPVLDSPQYFNEEMRVDVVYTAEQAINVRTVGGSEILVAGPGGYSVHAVFDHFIDPVTLLPLITPPTNGSPVVADYVFEAPPDGWNTHNGRFRIDLVSNTVKDTGGRAVPAAQLASFVVQLPPPRKIRAPQPRKPQINPRLAAWFNRATGLAANR